MAPLGTVLTLNPKYNGMNIPLNEWVERLESAAHSCHIPDKLIPELAVVGGHLDVCLSAWPDGTVGGSGSDLGFHPNKCPGKAGN